MGPEPSCSRDSANCAALLITKVPNEKLRLLRAMGRHIGELKSSADINSCSGLEQLPCSRLVKSAALLVQSSADCTFSSHGYPCLA
jgi:hypothetical protein